MSQRSGLLEWCEGTISIGDYLVGTTSAPNDGAHPRYHHSDWSNGECKRKMMSVSDIVVLYHTVINIFLFIRISSCFLLITFHMYFAGYGNKEESS